MFEIGFLISDSGFHIRYSGFVTLDLPGTGVTGWQDPGGALAGSWGNPAWLLAVPAFKSLSKNLFIGGPSSGIDV